MSPSIRIMLPTTPSINGNIYFKGFLSITEQREVVIYITEYSTKPDIVTKQVIGTENICGLCSDCYSKKSIIKSKNYFILERSQSLKLIKLSIYGNKVDSTDNCIIMLYDYEKMKNSEMLDDMDTNFSKLQTLARGEHHPQSHVKFEPMLCPWWLSSSMLIQHIFNYINLINWLQNTIRRDKKVSIKPGNLILAILADIITGYLALKLLTQDKKELSSILMGVLETLVNLLHSLLTWLMGAPAGLKLNNAFNKMLGKYFSYHIQLWWLFLDVSGKKLDIILHVFHYVGYLGFTFQAAMISDMICVATFHSYCIYIYAARIFNIQILGLIALLRLFVGRKYNPLRGGIDSCEYTNEELFVGTVAFTILLLLLPTTAMYYIVFTLFRLLSLIVQSALTKIIYLVQTLPIYVVALWLARSPKVAGNIFIETVNSEEGWPLVLKVKLFNKSLGEIINHFKSPVEAPKQFEWTNTLSNILIGKQII